MQLTIPFFLLFRSFSCPAINHRSTGYEQVQTKFHYLRLLGNNIILLGSTSDEGWAYKFLIRILPWQERFLRVEIQDLIFCVKNGKQRMLFIYGGFVDSNNSEIKSLFKFTRNRIVEEISNV